MSNTLNGKSFKELIAELAEMEPRRKEIIEFLTRTHAEISCFLSQHNISASSEVEQPNLLLAKPVTDLEMLMRFKMCLLAENIQTIGELVTRSEADLRRVPNVGPKTIMEIKKALALIGLKLKT